MSATEDHEDHDDHFGLEQQRNEEGDEQSDELCHESLTDKMQQDMRKRHHSINAREEFQAFEDLRSRECRLNKQFSKALLDEPQFCRAWLSHLSLSYKSEKQSGFWQQFRLAPQTSQRTLRLFVDQLKRIDDLAQEKTLALGQDLLALEPWSRCLRKQLRCIFVQKPSGHTPSPGTHSGPDTPCHLGDLGQLEQLGELDELDRQYDRLLGAYQPIAADLARKAVIAAKLSFADRFADRFQEASLGLCKALDSYQPNKHKGSFSSFARGIVRKALQHAEQNERPRGGDGFEEVLCLDAPVEEPEGSSFVTLKDLLVDETQPDPIDRLDSEQRLARVEQVWQELTADEQMVLAALYAFPKQPTGKLNVSHATKRELLLAASPRLSAATHLRVPTTPATDRAVVLGADSMPVPMSREQLAEALGSHKDHIRRLEKRALVKLRSKLRRD